MSDDLKHTLNRHVLWIVLSGSWGLFTLQIMLILYHYNYCCLLPSLRNPLTEIHRPYEITIVPEFTGVCK